jgi:hypothetical protein
MRFLLRGRGRRVALLVAVLCALAAGIAYASIPNSTTGVISSCYSQATGTWRPIDKQAGQTCKGGKNPETLLEWNASGPSGPSGPSGASGASGPSGPGGPGTVIAGSSGGETILASDYIGVGARSTSEQKVTEIVPVSGTLKNLYVHVETAPGNDTTLRFYLLTNGSLNGIQCDIADSAQTCSDTTNTLPISAGTTLDLIPDTSIEGSPTLSAVTWSVEIG